MLGFFTSDARSDALLADLALRLAADGLRLAGAVQVNAERAAGPCDMDLVVLGPGQRVRISQSLGPGSTGCRLDPGGLETAVALAEQALAGANLVLVNKFGKQEAEGRGFRSLIGRALAEGVPVLTAVSPGNRAAFAAFADGLAEELPPDPEALARWCRRSVALRV